MNIDDIKSAVATASADFSIKRAVLFGSRANGSFSAESDVDLIIEFNTPVTLITLGLLKERLESILKTSVDIIHGPLRDTDMLEIDKEIEIYAA
ncbi:MAG: nucleotidyltransferase domain-containing protein [Synergistales bacterium]|nr:nucleotidyltransferase domain-containing protein [Synergistaceae bacterium]MDY6399664.1 nucleotidyltransferase domain-containing protein [Synergistales bacterium]MDY6400899.1 nucleotidyltransferase domain-containing protein [Synergistales bacterium]MDY6405395.1 nucleotidyltransferase domain-containing protein [Synergistales bacterium]MDY6410056.1 nucleotidyltransferase domain-containing protein [Synergistales bacterium]